MVSEKHGVNFIDRITISIDISYYNNEKIMDDLSSLFNKKIKYIINDEITNLPLNINSKLSIKRVILDLGNIEIDLFEREITRRLEAELKKYFKKYHDYFKPPSNTEKIYSQPEKEKLNQNIYITNRESNSKKIPLCNFSKKKPEQSVNSIHPNVFYESSLIKKVDHYLSKGNWLSNDSKHHATNIVRIDNKFWRQINHQPQQWLPMLAKHCLQPAGLSRLIQLCQPDVLTMLCQLFTETTTSEFINSQAQASIVTKVTPEKLSFAAEYYLQQQMKHTHATQQALALQTQNKLTFHKNIIENNFNPLKQDNNEANTLTETALQTKIKQTPTVNMAQNDSNLLKQTCNNPHMQMDAIPPLALQPMQTHHQPTATQPHYGLIKEIAEQNPATLQNREQHKELPESALSAKISPIQLNNGIQTPSAQSVLPISNAGCIILWPLLPTFFRAFDLLEKNRFINLEAQREAVCLLDWLIWGEEEIPAWRLTLNKILCGLSIHDNARWHPPKPEQQIAINQWLEKIIEQLPAWKKMGVNDVRHLFLQRYGELSELNNMTNIHIKPEVYDALISEWPWPMNIASFSWLKHPITITWL
ncbi:contractile injection system tape measure protein [Xenorhabdus sp. PB62.4]|uniref:contractile injection system tape measure protein n=1 Tax=Xenorhabdus sp. PB62.4 TaxID=1851573 RepID=UPI00165760B8|nr:contractile injection system tape measure protein [Xenorhabdus sp. PB62.4]MBC8954025.1 hypothetical protein [Xenorhabdus sp. PB62.4]